MAQDRRVPEALSAPNFVEINCLGRFDREDLFNRLFPVLTLYEFIFEEPGNRITGESSAVLIYHCHEWLPLDGKQIEGTFHVFASYKRGGKQYQPSLLEIRSVG